VARVKPATVVVGDPNDISRGLRHGEGRLER